MECELTSTTRYWGDQTTKRAGLVLRVSYLIRGIIAQCTVQPCKLKSQKKTSFGLHWIQSSLICFPTWKISERFLWKIQQNWSNVFLPGPRLIGTKETKEPACRTCGDGLDGSASAISLSSRHLITRVHVGLTCLSASWGLNLPPLQEVPWGDLTLDHAAWEMSSLVNKAEPSHSPFKSLLPH